MKSTCAFASQMFFLQSCRCYKTQSGLWKRNVTAIWSIVYKWDKPGPYANSILLKQSLGITWRNTFIFIPHNSFHKRTFTIPTHSPRTAIALVIQLLAFASNMRSFQGLLSSPGTCLRSPSITRCVACSAAQAYTNWILPMVFIAETIGSPKILWRTASLHQAGLMEMFSAYLPCRNTVAWP